MSIPIQSPLLLLSVALFFGVVVFFVMTRNKQIMLKICIVLFAFSAIAGLSIYSYGYLPENPSFADILLAATRGIYSMVRMFLINDDYGNLTQGAGAEWFTGNIVVQIILWVSHLGVLIALQATLIYLLGKRLLDYFRFCYGSHSEVYIISSGCQNALLLGENILTHDGKQSRYDNKRLVVFLLGEQDDTKSVYDKASRFGGIVMVLDQTHSISHYLSKAATKKRKRQKRHYHIILMSNDSINTEDIRTLASYATKLKIPPENMNIYQLTSSEWEIDEIDEVSKTIAKDHDASPCVFHALFETDVLVRQMVEKRPPYTCLSFNESGMATNNFTVLIIGFGTVGQHALRRLVMNGQFEGSRMRSVIADKDVDSKLECFSHRYPSLELCCEITTLGSSALSYNRLFRFIGDFDNFDYIVVALDDEEENKQMAMDIRLYYERTKKDIPFIAVHADNGCLSLPNRSDGIFCFGCRDELFNESVIIRQETDLMAKSVNDFYETKYGGKPWHELDLFTQESNRAAADFIPAMLKIARLDEAEAIKQSCLVVNDNLADSLAKTQHLQWNAFHAAMGYSPMSIDTMHQRFDEAIELKLKDPLKYCRIDTVSKQHICLISWDELDDLSAAYRELEKLAGKNPERDFKENDRDVVKNIPEFLRRAKK